MTVLTDRLSNPSLRRVYLIEPTAGERLAFWTLESGRMNTYFADVAAPGRILGCREDGADLGIAASIDDVEATPGTYYSSGARVYVHTTGSASPYGYTIQAVLGFYFSNFGRIYNDIYYDPRIDSLPDMSLRVEPQFGAVGQFGSGTLTLLNNDGFFDAFALQWDAGILPIKMAVDPFDGEATYAEFDTVGTYKVSRWDTSDTKFTLRLVEPKVHVKKKIPIEFYTRDEFPLMFESDVGKVKQIAYGLILDVRPICINATTKRFKVAGHAIYRFLEARFVNETTGGWYTTIMTDLDEANGEVTLADWDLVQGVGIDFQGKPNPDGTLMDNASDIVRDLLQTYLGVTDAEIDDTVVAS